MIGAVTGGEMAIVVEGRREDWPRGIRTLTPHDPIREPNGRTLWFGAELAPDGSQVWFRIDEDAIGRMPEKTPAAPRAASGASAGFLQASERLGSGCHLIAGTSSNP